jgi:hypothetical protein
MKSCVKSDVASPVSIRPPTTNNKADDSGQTPRQLIPVLRKKRSDWSIPRINEQQFRQEERDQLEHLKEVFRGTTPTGRDLYRKILFGIRRRLERPGTKAEEVMAYARSEFETFASLEPEFKQLFIIDRAEAIPQGVAHCSPTLSEIATYLVIIEKLRLALESGLIPRGE